MSGNCKKDIFVGYGKRSCSKKAVRDGFCSIHHPEAVQKRDADLKARWKAESDARQKKWRLESAASFMSAALKEIRLNMQDDAFVDPVKREMYMAILNAAIAKAEPQ